MKQAMANTVADVRNLVLGQRAQLDVARRAFRASRRQLLQGNAQRALATIESALSSFE